jgi:predicted transcriptional regulator
VVLCGNTFEQSTEAMTAIQLRSELKELIDRIRDDGFLKALRPLLERTAAHDETTAEMIRMAELSEEDIKHGRVHTREEVERWLKEQKGK